LTGIMPYKFRKPSESKGKYDKIKIKLQEAPSQSRKLSGQNRQVASLLSNRVDNSSEYYNRQEVHHQDFPQKRGIEMLKMA